MPDRIDDLVVLGRAGPEPTQEGKHTVCLGGYSPTEGYIRLYPTQKRMGSLKRWNVVSVPVEDSSPEDTRKETYKIKGSDSEWDQLQQKIEVVDRLDKNERIQLVDELPKACCRVLNDRHQSLGVSEPVTIDAWLEENEEHMVQSRIDGKDVLSKNDFPQKLKIDFECVDCNTVSGHSKTCIEWGVYQYWKNHPEEPAEKAISGLRLNDEQYKKYLFIGNLNNRRNAYIVISVLRFKTNDLIKAGVLPDDQQSLDGFS